MRRRFIQCATPISNAPTIIVSGFFAGGGAPQGPQYTSQGSYEVQDFTSVARGNHQFKFGVRVRVTREENTYPMIAPGQAARDMVG